jgi:acetyltransferase-like isoleucine patch superfamily enzyme
MRRVLGLVARQEVAVVRAFDRARRAWFIARLRLLAAWRRTELDLDIAPDLRLGRRIEVKVAPRSKIRIHIGPRCRIGNDVLLFLTSGSLWWGDGVQLRVRSAINLTGELWCEGGNIFSYGTIIHCVESIRIHQWAGSAEYVTIVDSAHFHSAPDVCVSENTVSSPVRIGTNVFLAPRVSVNRGVDIGDFCVVGPNSTVVRDAPPGTLVSGVPATVVRSLGLAWVPPAVDSP